MSVKRYNLVPVDNKPQMIAYPEGEYVRHEDYAALEAVNDVLQGQVARLQIEICNLVKENTRLQEELREKESGLDALHRQISCEGSK